ncbi:MAG: hypothetical protein LBS08_06280 [Candidatus Symbiothrix sp.]|jgi:hypothetical protein|nr:hypothetical protein [Candidatus Symbiothrix sp.]
MTSRDRIIEFVEYKKISKNRFYKETGLSNGFLDKNNHPGADKLERIIYTYPEINPEWLLTGNGPMLRETNYVKSQTLPLPTNHQSVDLESKYTNNINTIQENHKKIFSELLDRIERLCGEITLLKKENEDLKKYTNTSVSVTPHIYES